jgi:hypothetical protein
MVSSENNQLIWEKLVGVNDPYYEKEYLSNFPVPINDLKGYEDNP